MQNHASATLGMLSSDSELFHYTSLGGLEGILRNQELWATNIRYLNDTEERVAFFDKRLAFILKDVVFSAFAETKFSDELAKRFDINSKEELANQFLNRFCANARKHALAFDEAYTLSFCYPPLQDADDGLLSQWRGYGKDGGYAVVFDAEKLRELAAVEANTFDYQHFAISDIEYFGRDARVDAKHEETKKYEIKLQEAVCNFILTGQTQSLEATYDSIKVLSCSTKHRGFSEEAEVRIVATPTAEAECNRGVLIDRPCKEVFFRSVSGMMVPYIRLFGKSNDVSLPIKRILVGPHPDREMRRTSLLMLLQRLGVQADVFTSTIPYRG